MRRFSILALIIALAIPLLVGGVSAAISAKGMAAYGSMNKPPLSPPGWVFSIAWTILYILMGLASYYVYVSEAESRVKTFALIFYGLQLVINFMWSIFFFNWDMYLVAFIWLMILWCIVIFCTIRFFSISRLAGFLLVPYVVWLTFAAYLNMGAYILNRNVAW